MIGSPAYQVAYPYAHQAGVSTLSAQKQLDLLRYKVPEGSTRILDAIREAEAKLRQADALVSQLIRVVQEELL